jgi:tetratricopeptide (TPR) repeat protein
MSKKITLLATVLWFISFMGSAQSVNTTVKKTYDSAIKSGDLATTITMLNMLLADNNNTPYADTLALLYTSAGSYVPAMYWIEKRINEKDAAKVALTEAKAACLKGLGDYKTAIGVYEELMKVNAKNPNYPWQLLNLQYDLKRNGEALATIDFIIKSNPDTALIVTVPVENNQGINVKYLAAVYNMKGIILFNSNFKKDAMVAFGEALKVQPDYPIAKQNFEAVKVEQEKAAKETSEVKPKGGTPK